MTPPLLNVEDILAAFNGHGVDYVVIGAFAAIAQGAPIAATYDVDITPDQSDENLRRLSDAVDLLVARIRTADIPEGLQFAHDAASLSGRTVLSLTCPAGDFDLVFTPAASPGGYIDLRPGAISITVGNQNALAASLDDIIRSKCPWPAGRRTYEPW